MTTNPHYGHKMLILSDFGGWVCRACGLGGDEQIKPNDYPCIAALPDRRECLCDWDSEESMWSPGPTPPHIVFRAKDCPIHGE